MTPSAARLLRHFFEQELGLEADSAYGRLRFAPRLRARSRTLHVTGIAVGDALVDVELGGSGRRYSLSLRQSAGRVPLNLVFAPWASDDGRAVEVFLDGARVEAEVSRTAGRTRIQMQFPLDRRREVEIDIGA